MSEASWLKLVERYRGDRTICNCGQAYYMPVGEEYFDHVTCAFFKNTSARSCAGGCGANKLTCRNEIADKIVEELGLTFAGATEATMNKNAQGGESMSASQTSPFCLPAECDWPVCGCDSYANKVIEALEKMGVLIDALPISPAGMVQSEKRDATSG